MVATWAVSTWCERDRSEPSDLERMLSLLARLGNPTLVERLLGKLTLRQGHGKADNPAILEALAHFEPAIAAGWLQKIMAANALEALGACAALLAGALKGDFAKTPAQLSGAMQVLIEQIPGDPASAPKDQWGRPRSAKPDAAFLVDLVQVVDRVDVGLAKHASRHVLAWPRHFGLDRVLVPAVKRLIQTPRRRGLAFDALYAAAIKHLETRIAETLEAPPDWTRPSGIGCQCQHCAELSSFLADAGRESWTLRAAQQIRTHVEHEIRRASADVDTETLRRGSPHSLICRKNQASYEQRVAQRKQDLADLAALRR